MDKDTLEREVSVVDQVDAAMSSEYFASVSPSTTKAWLRALIDEVRRVAAERDEAERDFITSRNDSVSFRMELKRAFGYSQAGFPMNGFAPNTEGELVREAQELRALLSRTQNERDDAVKMIARYGETLVNAGYPRGDRYMILQNIIRMAASKGIISPHAPVVPRQHEDGVVARVRDSDLAHDEDCPCYSDEAPHDIECLDCECDMRHVAALMTAYRTSRKEAQKWFEYADTGAAAKIKNLEAQVAEAIGQRDAARKEMAAAYQRLRDRKSHPEPPPVRGEYSEL